MVPDKPSIPRPRQLRLNPEIRSMVRETHVEPSQLVYPMFVTHGSGIKKPVASMPGIHQLSVDRMREEATRVHDLDIGAVLLFGIPAAKDREGSSSYAPDGVVQHAVRELKATLPDLTVITDVCLCEYTDHGHCGLVNEPGAPWADPNMPDGFVLNDPTLPVLAKIAVSHAEAGADFVAPSGMMDGMVAAIRQGLDDADVGAAGIMSYSVKYASAFYGPFRDAADGAPQFGDRRTHQMDPANAGEAIREVTLDIDEGADVVMVKPALPYLDIVRQTREVSEVPVAAYNVSGEYAMVKAAAANGWIDERSTVLEILTSIKRAGADIIVTYHALEAATWLKS